MDTLTMNWINVSHTTARMRQHTANAKHNDAQRTAWIGGDEGLYNLQRRSGMSMALFVRLHRSEIDKVIDEINEGHKPAHYLAYGG